MAQLINNGADATLNVADLVSDISELYGKQAWATTGIGYATGAGGAVTQATSKVTNVTLNKNCGQITMNAASLAAGAQVAFGLFNSLISSTDVVLVTLANGYSASTNYSVRVGSIGSGVCAIVLKNETAGVLAEAVILNFAIVKSVAA